MIVIAFRNKLCDLASYRLVGVTGWVSVVSDAVCASQRRPNGPADQLSAGQHKEAVEMEEQKTPQMLVIGEVARFGLGASIAWFFGAVNILV